jgi:YggT family protein
MTILCLVLGAYQLVLLAYVVLSWVPRPPEPLFPVIRVIRALVDPIIVPMRRVIPPAQLGGVALDLSIIVLFVILVILRIALGC